MTGALEPCFKGIRASDFPCVLRMDKPFRNSGAGNDCANFVGCLEFLCSFCRKTSISIKFLVLGGGVFWVLGGGGGSADFIFMGAGIFLRKRG